jgi:hypothetical protein
MLLAVSVQAEVPIPNPLPAFDFAFSPANPTSQDIVDLSISGLWPNTCVPNGTNVFVNGDAIEVRLLLPGALDCNEPICTPVLSAFGVTAGVGPLAPNVYNVFVRVVSCREATDTLSVGSFRVGLPVGEPNEPNEPNEPREVRPGTCLVLLQDVNDNGVALRAGQAGMVVCCDSADCSGRLLVSWFMVTQGPGSTDDCNVAMPRAMQPGTATWVDPNRVGLGICFDRCGTLGQNDEGCFTLTTDDRQVFLLVAGSWLPRFLGPDAEFELGDRVRVQGLINLKRPAGAFFACREQNGDIFNPLITPCAPSGGGGEGCCDAGFQPGDRVRLLVNNPPDQAGRPAVGLPAGTLGTVLCCNSSDDDFTVYVSWDNFTGGFNMSFLCDTAPPSFPADSGWWVGCDDIVLLSGGGNGGGGGQPCPNDSMTIGFGSSGIRLFRDPDCPDTSRTFSGCVNVTVTTNFRAKLSLKITPKTGVNGTWQGTITPDVVPAGQSNVVVCVTADDLNLAAIPAGQNVQVAQVSILAVPAP